MNIKADPGIRTPNPSFTKAVLYRWARPAISIMQFYIIISIKQVPSIMAFLLTASLVLDGYLYYINVNHHSSHDVLPPLLTVIIHPSRALRNCHCLIASFCQAIESALRKFSSLGTHKARWIASAKQHPSLIFTSTSWNCLGDKLRCRYSTRLKDSA